MKQVSGQGVGSGPGPWKTPARTPAQHQKPQRQGGGIAAQTQQGRTGGGLVECHGGDVRKNQQQPGEGEGAQLMEGELRLQNHTQPEPGEEDDGAAEAKGPSDPGETAGKTAQPQGKDEDPPFMPVPAKKQS